MSIDLHYTMPKVIAPVPNVSLHRKPCKGISLDVFFSASAAPVYRWVFPTYTDSQSNVLGDIRLSRLLLIHPEIPHEILARDVEPINQ